MQRADAPHVEGMLVTEYFRNTVIDEADGRANGGRGKLALVPPRHDLPLRTACRDALPAVSEQDLLNHVMDVVATSGYAFSRSLVVDCYVSLKTNPLVILTGPQGCGKAAFMDLFAEALLGRGSPQYARISGDAAWLGGTGEHGYFRALQERFGSLRFMELIQEAGDPGNLGKLFIVCFDALHPHELDYYFTRLVLIGRNGEKRLNLPGYQDGEQPLLPENLLITATVRQSVLGEGPDSEALRHASLIQFRRPVARVPVALRPAAPVPVGYQRMWLRAALRDVEQARQRLLSLLGPERLNRLTFSPALGRLLWRGGLALSARQLQEVTVYVANSFGADGRGLFDPEDAGRNAQIAYDAQVVQRVLWRLPGGIDPDLHTDLTRYLDDVARCAGQQAVA